MSSLDEIAPVKTLRLTTVGRKSGLERHAQVWFVVDGDAIWVQAGARGVKGWYANARANPQVHLQVRARRWAGRAECVDAPEERQRVAALFRRKYLLARLAGWLGAGIGHGRPLRIQLTAE